MIRDDGAGGEKGEDVAAVVGVVDDVCFQAAYADVQQR
jgi:hypothetical protein